MGKQTHTHKQNNFYFTHPMQCSYAAMQRCSAWYDMAKLSFVR